MSGSREHPASPSPAASLVGRGRELATLVETLAATLAGRGSLVLVGGEAGIGKTALAEATLRDATARGCAVLAGRCYDLSETPPYGPWAEAVARAPRDDRVPKPDFTGAGVASQPALFTAVRDYLAALAARHPLVLLLDDLHWADQGSLDLLRVLGRQLADLPLLLLATYRADELTRRHPLYQLLPTLVREVGAHRLDLRRLDVTAIETFVAARYPLAEADRGRLVAYLLGRTEGNALFLGELVRALVEEGLLRPIGTEWALGDVAHAPVPALLLQVIDGRVARLGETRRQVLAAAAVIGHAVPFPLWQSVAEEDEDALLAILDRAAEARLVQLSPDGSGFRFAHALIREALYEGITPLRRRARHRQIAEALLTDQHMDPDTVAHHLQRAGDERAADWLGRAGDRARLAYAWTTAIERYEAALTLLGDRDDRTRERVGLLYRLGVILRFTDPRRGVEALDEAARLLDADADPALAARLRLYRGLLRCIHGEIPAGLALLREAAGALEALPSEVREAAILDGPDATNDTDTVALWLAIAGHLDEAEALGEYDLANMSASAPGWRDHNRTDIYGGMGLVHLLRGQLAAARSATIRSEELSRAIGHHFLAALGAFRRLIYTELVYGADNPAELARVAARAEADWQAVGGTLAPFPPGSAWIPILVLAGRWQEARAREAQLPSGIMPDADIVLAQVAIGQGEFDHAALLLGRRLPGGPATALGTVALPHVLACQHVGTALALATSDLGGARAWLEARERALAWSGAVWGRAAGQVAWAVYYRASGDAVRARSHAERALADAAEPRQPLVLLAAHRFLGELDSDVGRHAEAQSHLDAALALADACGAPYERALTLLALTELHTATGDGAGARETLAVVRSILASLEARPALARADALAARLDAAPSTVPTLASTGLPFGLTAREAEVLRLVAQGLGNLDIADRLSLSRRTVEQHLRNAYDKLGVENRAAATRVAVEHGLA